MIQSNELRIGNLVECFGIRNVCSIEENKIKVKHESSEGHFILEWVPINSLSLKPIPLTEEWLLKFGFKKELDGFYRKNMSPLIEVVFYDDFKIQTTSQSICLNHVVYLHQFQNLYFALTGNELTL